MKNRHLLSQSPVLLVVHQRRGGRTTIKPSVICFPVVLLKTSHHVLCSQCGCVAKYRCGNENDQTGIVGLLCFSPDCPTLMENCVEGLVLSHPPSETFFRRAEVADVDQLPQDGSTRMFKDAWLHKRCMCLRRLRYRQSILSPSPFHHSPMHLEDSI